MANTSPVRFLVLCAPPVLYAMTAEPAAANMILPLIFVHIWPGLLAVFPVGILEGLIVERHLRAFNVINDSAINNKDTVVVVVLANVASFVVGAILSFVLTDLIEIAYSDELDTSPFGMFLLALLGWSQNRLADSLAWTATVLILFAMSWLIESVFLRLLTRLDFTMARRAMLRANAWSYGILLTLGLLVLSQSPSV